MQLPKLLQGSRRIRKQKQPCLRIFLDLNSPVLDTIINPMWVNVNGSGNLRDGERSLNPPGMGLRAVLKDPMLEPNASNSAG